MDEEVYLSISFPKISINDAIRIRDEVIVMSGPTSVNVYFDSPIPDEETEEDDG